MRMCQFAAHKDCECRTTLYLISFAVIEMSANEPKPVLAVLATALQIVGGAI